MSHVLAVCPVFPAHVYEQSQITASIGSLLTSDPSRRAALERVHAHAGVDRRHLALPLEQYGQLTSFGAANDVFLRVGADLATEACAGALAQAGLVPVDVDWVFCTTVTGVGAPSLDALVAQRVGWRPDIRRRPSFGLGCAGGAAGLAAAEEYLLGHPRAVAVVLSVELCSLTFQRGDDSVPNLVASGLFGDGATAVVLAGAEHPAAGRGLARVVGSRSALLASSAAELGWRVSDSGFRIVLSPGVPDLLRSHLLGEVKGLLAHHDRTISEVGTWVVHAGGPRIIDAVRDGLGLDEPEVALSRAVLRTEGNLSSSSVLHVLAQALVPVGQPATPGPPTTVRPLGTVRPPAVAVLMAFGPGVGVELVLLSIGGTGEGAG